MREAEDPAERQRNKEEARWRNEDEVRCKKEQKEHDARAKREAVEVKLCCLPSATTAKFQSLQYPFPKKPRSAT